MTLSTVFCLYINFCVPLQAQSSTLCTTIIDVINSIYHQDNANYFILVPQNTLSQFIEKIHTKSPDVQVCGSTLVIQATEHPLTVHREDTHQVTRCTGMWVSHLGHRTPSHSSQRRYTPSPLMYRYVGQLQSSRPHNTLSQFIEKIHTKSPDVQVWGWLTWDIQTRHSFYI